MKAKPEYVICPECRSGLCRLCSGNGPVYAPGKRRPVEPPIMILRCDHAHGRPSVGAAR